MRRLSRVTIVVTLIVTAGCYHATIDTGATPSTVVISKEWAAGWIYGLVPPSTVETASTCPNGVAKVETQLSFLNQLVAFLTFEIYTPMSIKVTCAAPRTADAGTPAVDVIVSEDLGRAAVASAFDQAANQAIASHRAVLVEVR
jgi:Bor protein